MRVALSTFMLLFYITALKAATPYYGGPPQYGFRVPPAQNQTVQYNNNNNNNNNGPDEIHVPQTVVYRRVGVQSPQQVAPPPLVVPRAPQLPVQRNVTNYTANSVPAPQQSRGHDLILGQRSVTDVLLATIPVVKRTKIFSDYVSKEVEFSAQNRNSRRAIITYIHARDNTSDGSGGIPKLVRGGIGKPEVEIKIKSEYRKPINFVLHIYGRNQ